MSVLGILLMALVGASAPNDHTVAVRLPLSVLPPLSASTSTLVMIAAIAAQALGLLGMLTAMGHGWRPGVPRLFAAGAAAVVLCSSLAPIGSADIASYAAYGRIAALGGDPYRLSPADLGGGYAQLVSPSWLHAPSVYGPLATWIQQAAAAVGGDRPWLTIWLLMLANAAAFLATGLLLVRVARDGSRAALLWVANPLLIGLLVAGGHLDTFVALLAAAALVVSKRVGSRRVVSWRADAWYRDATVGVLLGLACGLKVSTGLVVAGVVFALLLERAWARALRLSAAAALTVLVLYAGYGMHALTPLGAAAHLVSVPSLWQGVHLLGNSTVGGAVTDAVIGLAWPVVTVAVARWLRPRLPRATPLVLGIPFVLSLAWVLAAPWSMPWYTAVSWLCAAVLPRNALVGWLLAATTFLALMHNTGGRGWAW
ncbi:hypothetical protein EDD99_6244 [Streptomyces sp. 846.5]|nr:polyprenol phosphomannose-dependent alpha 1,6 mannosyltransferase MptB [Streptomyces sp. 846.5]TDT98032.1 hypothetical protein EDD99_6244 [Streptomyces sp. 846.5]